MNGIPTKRDSLHNLANIACSLKSTQYEVLVVPYQVQTTRYRNGGNKMKSTGTAIRQRKQRFMTKRCDIKLLNSELEILGN